MEVTDWLSALRGKRTEQKRTSHEDYVALRDKLHAGQNVPVEEIDAKLAAAGVDPERLSDHLSIMKEMAALRTRRTQDEKTHARHLEILKELDKAGTERAEFMEKSVARVKQLEEDAGATKRDHSIDEIDRKLTRLTNELNQI